MQKPYAESCDQNRDAILAVIKPLLESRHSVLEIGSGTGQHAVYFASHLPHLVWQTSDQSEYLAGVSLWLEEAQLENLPAPLELDVAQATWPDIKFDAVFSANTLHIMHWHEVEALFAGIADRLKPRGLVMIYGPFNYDNRYTSESNARFDAWLKSRDAGSGIRNYEEVNRLAQQHGFSLQQDYAMPANNRILCWRKR
ncbi:MAG: DUF938 domain-containing protein [Thioalkalispiraceae bacterium]|jgi:cyclopropane fatty-acyl-phospholipid synthase-like methyltransferase